MRPQWVPYPVERGAANARPFPPAGEKGSADYLAAGRWWDRPDHAMGNCLRGFASNERRAQGGEQVIPTTSSSKKHKNRAAVVAEQGRL